MDRFVRAPDGSDSGPIVEPPVPLQRVLTTLLTGFGLSIVACLARIIVNPTEGSPALPSTLIALLGFSGGIVTGAGLSLAPHLILAWLVSAVNSLILSLAMPETWDSFQLFFRVFAAVALIAAILLMAPMRARLMFAGGAVLLHFAGIFSAATSPNPQPWVSNQLWTRIFRPYLHFIYMNNAYQFYSPDPGPARELWVLIEYVPKPEFDTKYPMPPADGEKGYFRWVKMPQRPYDYSDPLGQAYYRRLSLTEHIASFNSPNYAASTTESVTIDRRRRSREDIPLFPEYAAIQYQQPTMVVQRMYLPSYAKRFAIDNQHPEFRIKSLKIYRVTHQILTPQALRGTAKDKSPEETAQPALSPYEPTTYQVYFQGEFDTEGNILNPSDPMLFWLLPIRHRAGSRPQEGFSQKLRETDFDRFLSEYHRCYDDYVVKHAGFDHQKGGNLP